MFRINEIAQLKIAHNRLLLALKLWDSPLLSATRMDPPTRQLKSTSAGRARKRSSAFQTAPPNSTRPHLRRRWRSLRLSSPLMMLAIIQLVLTSDDTGTALWLVLFQDDAGAVPKSTFFRLTLAQLLRLTFFRLTLAQCPSSSSHRTAYHG